ncbi:hypothetical protein BDV95DRAFT_133461 [Massariosphaeria phaeospora]|uniref:Altered inheritance of mitochondria protein 9, mitochondrial n=1 Tax=Massariosphaeria phaeospora TaxID=100035 RepID=A0A7C8IL26_9PLEO|nr:hypothetical protein BDV95DRAFT_133461 [Massariosphaeria phaeospora]
MAISVESNEDLYHFTGGRWLSRDVEERNARHLRFNLEALCAEVVKACEGATAIAGFEKLDCTSNRALVFQTDNGKKAVAKLPFKLGGPSDLLICSEVATIKYLRTKGFPTPRVLAYSSNTTNPVGTQYIIMEHTSGVQLSQKWETMSIEQKAKCIQSVHEKLKPMVDLEFPAYGRIYETTHAVNTNMQAIPIDQDFCVGQDCSPMYWDGAVGCERFYHQVRPNRGPWVTFEAYVNGGIDASIAGIPSENSPYITMQARPSWHGTPAECMALLEQLRTVVKTIANDSKSQDILDASKPMLMNYLPKRHVFVSEADPTVVTDIIDFQHSRLEAAYAHPAVFIAFLEPGINPTPEDETLTQLWMQTTMQHTRKLMAPMMVSQTLFRPIATCDTTWLEGAPNLRWALQELREAWGTLGFESGCPIPELPEAEAKKLAAEHIKSEAGLMMRMTLSRGLQCRLDGFVPREEWNQTMRVLLHMWAQLKEGLRDMEVQDGVVMAAEDTRMTWPFDIPSQIGEDLVMIAPKYISTAIPGLFAADPEPEPQQTQAKPKVKEAKKEKGESKGGLFKGLKKRFG